MKKRECGCCNEGSHQTNNSQGVEFHGGLGAVQVAFVKLCQSQSAELSSFATGGSRRFAGANLGAIAESVALEFAWMNRSAVVSAGGQSRPTDDFFAAGFESQRKVDVNVLHLVPAQRDGQKRVSYSNALIKDLNFWVNKNQIGADYEDEAPKGRAKRLGQVLCEPNAHNEPRDKQQGRSGIEVATQWPEDLNIIHTPIISGRKQLASAGRD